MFLASGDGRDSIPSTSSIHISETCHSFEFSEILTATQNFSESLVIGEGGFGKVYKGGVIYGSSVVVVAAIKRLDSLSNQGEAEFWAEVKTLSVLRHCNLVSLIGFCHHEKEMILVYDYMPNGTLDDHLHKLRTRLSWTQRLNICIGAGRGLHYLHTGTGIASGIIHRDFKSSNILLHESWAAKISDFGLSKTGPTNQPSTYVNTMIKGTFGYLDPDYFTTGRLSRKTDVYAFGVVLLEVLCRKPAVDRSVNDEQRAGLVPRVQDLIKKGNLKRIIDSEIRSEISPKCLKEFVGIAERCFDNNLKQRPTMAEVLVSLESVVILQEKFNNSLQHVSRTMFDRMLGMFSLDSLIRQIKHADWEGKFTFAYLASATDNFSQENIISVGRSATVYKGTLSDGRIVAIKRGQKTPQKPKSIRGKNGRFGSELALLSRVHHENLVWLIGYCEEEGVKLLVYDYKENGSLYDHLHGTKTLDKKKTVLNSWKMRIKILLDAARGIDYLHNSCVPLIIHGDIKSSNILLDVNWGASVSDTRSPVMGPEYDLWGIPTKGVWTLGYVDPEYSVSNVLTTNNDIYSFGVVMLEVLTGKKPIFMSDDHNGGSPIRLAKYADPAIILRGDLVTILDKSVRPPEVNEVEAVELMAYTAVSCVYLEKTDKLTVKEVVANLERAFLLCE